MYRTEQTVWTSIYVSVLLIFGYILYSLPILSSWFIFDDFSNLIHLEVFNVNRPASLNSVLEYLHVATQTNLLGRPLSLLSFIPQYQDWLKTPVNFKLVNLTIHLCNTFLVYKAISFSLTNICSSLSSNHISTIALLTAVIWCFHPLNVSTVHYIVQRMTLMSALFSLSAMILYHSYIQRSTPASITTSILSALGIHCIIWLGILSKENAVLTYPLLMLITLCSSRITKNKHILFKWLLIYLPLLIGLISFIFLYDKLLVHGYIGRDFTITERILTETRVVLFYIWQMIVPIPDHYSLFHDHFVLSESIFNPINTLFALAAWAVIFLSLFIIRNTVWRFAWLWFLISHLLESTVIPLELVFEHRNYIAMLGPLMLINYYIVLAANKWTTAKTVFYGLIPVIFISSGIKVAQTWGQPLKQAQVWYEAQPTERRTNQYAEQLLFNEQYTLSYNLFNELYNQTNKASYLWQVLSVSCQQKDTPLPTVTQFKTAKFTKNSISKSFLTIKHVLESKLQNNCSIPNSYLSELLDELTMIPAYQFNAFYRYTSYFYYSDQQIERSINILETAHKLFPHMVTDIDLLSILLEHNRINHATIELLNSLQASHSIMSNGEQQYFERTLQKYNALIHNISNYSSEK